MSALAEVPELAARVIWGCGTLSLAQAMPGQHLKYPSSLQRRPGPETWRTLCF